MWYVHCVTKRIKTPAFLLWVAGNVAIAASVIGGCGLVFGEKSEMPATISILEKQDWLAEQSREPYVWGGILVGGLLSLFIGVKRYHRAVWARG